MNNMLVNKYSFFMLDGLLSRQKSGFFAKIINLTCQNDLNIFELLTLSNVYDSIT